MKSNKICALALAALTLFGLNACKDKNDDTKTLELTPTSTTLKVGEGQQLVANITVDEWKSSNEPVATVDDLGLVTAVSEGTAIISATANGTTKTCVVKVVANGDDDSDAKEVKGSQIWPIILDATTAEANASKVVASFAPNDVDQYLYVWDNTYVANDAPTGLNFYGNTEGFTAMKVASTWSGAGFCLTADGTGWQAAEALRTAIVANPDDYYLHLAIKSTDDYSHCFYMFGSEATKFVLGKSVVYDGPVYSDFTRDGAWQEFDIPMSKYATALAATTCAAGVNVFVVLSEGVVGAQLNLDAVYFYKK